MLVGAVPVKSVDRSTTSLRLSPTSPTSTSRSSRSPGLTMLNNCCEFNADQQSLLTASRKAQLLRMSAQLEWSINIHIHWLLSDLQHSDLLFFGDTGSRMIRWADTSSLPRTAYHQAPVGSYYTAWWSPRHRDAPCDTIARAYVCAIALLLDLIRTCCLHSMV